MHEKDPRREPSSRMVTRLRSSRIKVPHWLQCDSSRMHAEGWQDNNYAYCWTGRLIGFSQA